MFYNFPLSQLIWPVSNSYCIVGMITPWLKLDSAFPSQQELHLSFCIEEQCIHQIDVHTLTAKKNIKIQKGLSLINFNLFSEELHCAFCCTDNIQSTALEAHMGQKTNGATYISTNKVLSQALPFPTRQLQTNMAFDFGYWLLYQLFQFSSV